MGHILEKEDITVSCLQFLCTSYFQGLLYEILNGFWTQLTAKDDQGMGKDLESFCS